MRAPVPSSNWLKEMRWELVALNSFTGTVTRPKLIAPLQMARAIAVLLAAGWRVAGHRTPRVKMPWRGRWDLGSCGVGLVQGDGVTHAFQLSDQRAGFAFGVAAPVEVVPAELGVGHLVGQDVPGGDEDGVTHRAGGLGRSLAAAQPVVLGGQVDVLAAGGGLGRFGQRLAQPRVALAGPAGLASPGRLVVARAHPGPRRQMRRGGEAGHVSPRSAWT